MRSILVDAGPLIALLVRADKNHLRVKKYLDAYVGRLLTTWPVLAEACHFLPERTQIRFLRWAASGGLNIAELHESALATIAEWKEKYRDLPMDLADASLVLLAEELGEGRILSTDQRDFKAYRWKNTKPFQNLLFSS